MTSTRSIGPRPLQRKQVLPVRRLVATLGRGLEVLGLYRKRSGNQESHLPSSLICRSVSDTALGLSGEWTARPTVACPMEEKPTYRPQSAGWSAAPPPVRRDTVG